MKHQFIRRECIVLALSSCWHQLLNAFSYELLLIIFLSPRCAKLIHYHPSVVVIFLPLFLFLSQHPFRFILSHTVSLSFFLAFLVLLKNQMKFWIFCPVTWSSRGLLGTISGPLNATTPEGGWWGISVGASASLEFYLTVSVRISFAFRTRVLQPCFLGLRAHLQGKKQILLFSVLELYLLDHNESHF